MRFIKKLTFAVLALVSLSLFAVVPAAANPIVHAVTAAGDVVVAPQFEIPVVPAVILLVLQFVSPYITSLFVAFNFSSTAKRIVAVVVSFVLAAVVLLVSLWVGWLPVDTSPLGIVTLVLLGLGVQQAAYSLLFKESADELSKNVGVGKLN